MTITKERTEVLKEDKWNVEALFKTTDEWNEAFDLISKKNEPNEPNFKELIAFKETLHQGPDRLKEAFETILTISRQLSKLYTYAHLRHDEEITNDQFKVALAQISGLLHHFQEEMAWFEPEILALPQSKIEEYLEAKELVPYRFALEKIVRLKKHTLEKREEELLALSGKALETAHKAFSAINDADFKFKDVTDSKGNQKPLTHGLYSLYLRDQDRVLRENSFKTLHLQYEDFENSLTEILNGQVQNHWFQAKARKYNSCLEASLFPKNVEPEVYHTLIKTVSDHLAPLKKYMKVRERILKPALKGEPLHIFDMQVPLTEDLDIKMNYKEAEDIVIESVSPLGKEYQNILREGLKTKRWVDRYENKNKRSGAYSSGCFDSEPYILMNFKGILRDVFTLAHEAGHSMHSFLSNKNQPYQYADYPIFLAEVASTFNEELLMQTLLKRFTKKEEQIFLINQKIEDIRGTLFRQTCFAEFELLIHTLAEQNTPLTPALLKGEYRKLNQKYYGESVFIDKEIDIEFARIPHFYYNFYVYQYATGISAAFALSEKVSKGGEKEREDYLKFLKSGNSDYPLPILKRAGVDMCTGLPVERLISQFSNLVDKLDILTKS